MSLNRMIVASVVTHGVFERFAKLSAQDKKKVVEKVKDKVKSKKNDDKKDDKKSKGTKDDKKSKKPAKGKVPPQFEKKDEEKDEAVEKDDKKSKKPEKGKIPPQFEKKDEEKEEAVEDGMSDDEESKGLEGIVDGLVKEVEVIKGDGKVEVSEVMGLIDKMMGMVDTLVNAKPARQKKASEEEIADRVALDILEA